MDAHEQAEWTRLKAFWSGLSAAKLYIVAPLVLSFPVMLIFGEGDYLLALWSALYAALFVYGAAKRNEAQVGSVERWLGFHIALWSFVWAIVFGTLAILFASYGGWRTFD